MCRRGNGVVSDGVSSQLRVGRKVPRLADGIWLLSPITAYHPCGEKASEDVSLTFSAPRLVKGQLRKTQKASLNNLEHPAPNGVGIQPEGTSLGFTGPSYNGSTCEWHSQDRGSTPRGSTNLLVFGIMALRSALTRK